jgi:hypothetical protein
MSAQDKWLLIGWAIGMGQSLLLLAIVPWLAGRFLAWAKRFLSEEERPCFESGETPDAES